MNKMKIFSLAIFAILQLSIIGNAEALFVVDTGEPTGTTSSFLSSDQFLAGQFSLAGTETITGLEAWLSEEIGGTLTMVLYSGTTTDAFNIGLVPDDTTEIFSQSLGVTGGGGTAFHDWNGLSGLSLVLGPGDYWLALEVRNEQTYADHVLGGGQSSLLPEEAFFQVQNGWVNEDGAQTGPIDLGVRISAADPVPEPMTVMTLGFSLLGGAAFRRKRFTV
jgi:hypothetical protein